MQDWRLCAAHQRPWALCRACTEGLVPAIEVSLQTFPFFVRSLGSAVQPEDVLAEACAAALASGWQALRCPAALGLAARACTDICSVAKRCVLCGAWLDSGEVLRHVWRG